VACRKRAAAATGDAKYRPIRPSKAHKKSKNSQKTRLKKAILWLIWQK